MADNSVLFDLIDGLNPPQREAVTHSYDANTLVIAGAGSGKTSVLTRRIAFIVGNGHSPDSIMAVTFTNKASDEMRKRVSSYVGEDRAKKIMMGTFHSICVKLLRQFGKEVNIPKYFTIYDTSDAKQIMKEALLEVSGNYDKEDLNNCVTQISNLKNNMVTPEMSFQNAQDMRERMVSMVYQKYQNKLLANQALDFDDIILRTVFMLRGSKRVRDYCNRRFKFVMCDEVQDSNDSQYELLELIAGRNNIFVVGDEAQSLYSWRGANINNIINFQNRYENCRVIKLERNYRSTQTIVNASNKLVEHNTQRLDKVCYSNSEVGEPIKVFKAINDREECGFIISEIKNLVSYHGKQLKDIAVLYRVNRLTRELEDQLMANGISYEVVSGLSFYDRKEIKDTTSIMKSVVNPDDDVAFKRFLSIMPKIGKKTIDKLSEIARDNSCSLHDAVSKFDGKSKANIVRAMTVLGKLLKFSKYPVSEFLLKSLELTGYIGRLSAVNTEENKARLENLEELQNVAHQFEEKQPNDTITEFLDRLALSSESDGDSGDNRVKLMTVHAAKGLEYDTVFIMACEEGLMPHKRCETQFEVEEERRLMYTAMTRAGKSLYITHAQSRYMFGKHQNTLPSRFLIEVPNQFKIEL